MRNVLDSRFYRYLEVFSAFLFLSVVWFVACLPVFTVFPATAALFAVVREWVNRGEFDGAVRGFFAFFRANFWQSLGVGLLWTLLGALLAINLLLVGGMPNVLRIPLYVFFLSASLFYVTTSAFLFPVLVNFDADWRTVLKNSFLLSLSQLPTTLACLAVFATAVFLVLVVPVAALFAGSLTAYAVYRLCARTFGKVAAEGGRNFPESEPPDEA